jgi:hypothetical protein
MPGRNPSRRSGKYLNSGAAIVTFRTLLALI